MASLTTPQRRVLDLAATFTDIAGSNVTDETRPCVSTTVAERLIDAGLLEVTAWTGSVDCYRITDEGRAALEAS